MVLFPKANGILSWTISFWEAFCPPSSKSLEAGIIASSKQLVTCGEKYCVTTQKKDSKSSTFLVIDPAVWMIGRTTGPFSPGVDSYYKRLRDKHKIRNNYLNKSWIYIQFRKEPRPKQEYKWNAPVSSDKLHLGFRSRKREQSECWRARLKGLDKMGQYRRIGFKNRQGTNCFWSSFRQIAWHLATI